MTQKIIPHLWYNKEAKAAAEFYVSVFPDSKIKNIQQLHNTPSGDVDIVSFSLAGLDFMSISAGPYFKFTPAISFIVGCETREEIDGYWKKLSKGGKVLMPIDQYFFSERYGWIQDKYGLSWQLILTKPEGEKRPKIVPSMLFVGKQYGNAEKAIDFYLSVFENSKLGNKMKYDSDQGPNKKGTIMYADFKLEDLWISAMDGGGNDHSFTFNEAVSLIVNCDTQKEIDYYWEKLSAVPEAEQCGWLKDKFGVSWQINPNVLGQFMNNKDPIVVQRVTEAFLKMKKFNIAELEKAAKGK